ncbi:MAG: BNR repeat-containing protein [Saprospiraceae bacterium]|nr:BNR repeat-containing protein [Saprospiraceae bacterium]
MNKGILSVFASIYWTLCLAQPDLASAILVHESLVDPHALTIDGSFGKSINGKSFQQDIIVSHQGYQYLCYYDAGRRVCISRRQLPEGEWETIHFSDYNFKSNDAHNIISIGICPADGTIHLAFDHHGDTLHYRRSIMNVASEPEKVTWNASLFLPIQHFLQASEPIRITYPRFWQTPDGGLQFCYRRGGSGNGDRMLVDYIAGVGEWQNTRQIDSHAGVFSDEIGTSDSRCSYPNGYQYGPTGKLHTTWVWRESSQGANHDLVYLYSEDMGNSWKNNDGRRLEEPCDVNTQGSVVVAIGRDYGLMNTHGQTIDYQGRVHVVMWHCTDASLEAAGSVAGEERWGPPLARRYHHYWRDLQGEWQHTELPFIAGNRPKIFVDENARLYVIFSHRDAQKQMGDLVIATADPENSWKTWEIIYEQSGPFVNEMLADFYRWKHEEILSIIVQEFPQKSHDPTPLKVLDFKFE